jgi:hypothetical protein
MKPEQRLILIMSSIIVVLALDLFCVKTANGNMKAHIPEHACQSKQYGTRTHSRSVRANGHSASLGVGCSRSNCN